MSICQTRRSYNMKIKLRQSAFILLIFFTVTALNAQSGGLSNGLSRGESLFKENNAKDAVQVLEYEILNGQISDNTYNFLGLGYYQLDEYEKSLDAFKRGLKAQPDNAKILSYNMGNTYYAMKNYSAAAECYSDALKAEPLFYEALLNRANALLMAGQLVSAKEEYIDFVAKCPDDPQRERIELLIKALEEEIARREEEARLLAEQNKAKWEEYDGNLDEKKSDSFSPYWEEVDALLADEKKPEDSAEWERIHGEEPGAVDDGNASEAIAQDDAEQNSKNWEKFDTEPAGEIVHDEKHSKDSASWEEFENESESVLASGNSSEKIKEERVDDEEDWLTFSDEELVEMKALEEESRAEREKWLEDVRRREAQAAERTAQTKQKEQQQYYEDEKRMREQLLEDMRKAEEERRKKLLEDVANSLQGTDSTNLTSGAEDLIDYDLEGELD